MDEVTLLDDAFTYGGWAAAFLALGLWLWFARRAFPTFDTFVRGFDDEMHFGATPEERSRIVHSNRLKQLAVVLTTVAAVSLLVGFAIPD